MLVMAYNQYIIHPKSVNTFTNVCLLLLERLSLDKSGTRFQEMALSLPVIGIGPVYILGGSL